MSTDLQNSIDLHNQAMQHFAAQAGLNNQTRIQLQQSWAKWKGEAEQKMSDWVHTSGDTVTVGPSGEYETLTHAISVLRRKFLRRPLTLQLQDGEHQMNKLWVSEVGGNNVIYLRGNPDNPDACVIRFTADAKKQSHGLVVRTQQPIVISGIKFLGSIDADNNYTQRLIRVDRGAFVYVPEGTVKLVSSATPLEVGNGGVVIANKLDIRDFGVAAMNIFSGGNITSQNTTVRGRGRTHVTTRPDGTQSRCNSIVAQWNSMASFAGLRQSDVYDGISALYGSCVYAPGIESTNTRSGMRALYNSTLVGTGSISGCDNGVASNVQSSVYAPGLVVNGAAGQGFRSRGGFIDCANATVRNSEIGMYAEIDGYIIALDTKRRMSGNKVNYNPGVSGQVSNAGGMIVYS